MIAVDTNVLLRYLLEPTDVRNPAWQATAAVATINSADSVFLSDIVLAETEWVLETAFELNKTEIHHALKQLACNTRFHFEDWNALLCALMDYKEYPNVDFSDCLIARRANSKGAKTLYSFESRKKLGALPVVTSLEKP
ncbi:PIN domain-containing protein [Endozoicomonas sp. ONNA2]|uniref:PIN domain-containing protein n=1 Tax=Endozoicomonas sp. ONNA2 TaxID=2828741 RepID=UPI0021483CE9|nr:type II toxin-antitoxin system VapC family toxin [Endozoicomonas sp. ONNA2]